MKILHIVAAMALGLVVPCALHAASICPAVGDATAGCDLIITVTNGGFSVATGPSYLIASGTYDGNDDTLIGIVNNSTSALSSIALSSTTDIYGFDGDGIDTFGVTGNASDTTGYGGPDSFFTNINAAKTSGIVNFLTPLAANGGSTYFSFEEALSPMQINSTPEPGTLVLLGTGLVGCCGAIRRRFIN